MITDGAFPTRGTMLAYILRWAEIYVAQSRILWKIMPRWVFRFLGLGGPAFGPSAGCTAASPTSSAPSPGSRRAPG